MNFFGPKNNYELLKRQKYTNTMAGRDVYNDQQLDRGDMPEMKSIGPWIPLIVLGGVATAAAVYMLWCVGASAKENMAAKAAAKASQEALLPDEDEDYAEDSRSSSGGYQFQSDMFREQNDYRYSTEEESVQEGSGYSSGYQSSGSGGYQFKSQMFSEAGYNSLEGTEGSSYGGYGTEDMEEGPYGADGYHSGYPEEGQDAGSYPDDIIVMDGDGSLDEPSGTEISGGEASAGLEAEPSGGSSSFVSWRCRGLDHLFFSAMMGFAMSMLLYEVTKRKLDAQNAAARRDDINQYKNDQHIALPEELQDRYEWFPDAGAHCSVQANSLISHMMIANKGIRKIKVSKRYAKDVIDGDTLEVIYYAGDIVRDENGDAVTETMDLFDMQFGLDLYAASGAPEEVRKWYDVRNIDYNRGRTKRDKLPYDTVAEMINKDWTFPEYEVQRPAGVYLVDQSPLNTLVKVYVLCCLIKHVNTACTEKRAGTPGLVL